MTATSGFDTAVSSDDQNLLVIAPPGCGKTELLARRAEVLIPRLRPNQRILALTFSNKAKANLKSRLVEVLGFDRTRRYVAVRNFHGHAAEIIRSHGPTIGIDPQFPQPGPDTQSATMSPYLEGLTDQERFSVMRRIDDELRQAKRRPCPDDGVLDRLLRAGADSRTVEVERDRQRAGQFFYDDLLRHAQRLLRVTAVARLFQAHYGAVLVDEFQDLSPQQLDIALRSCQDRRVFVGDPLQGIYSWAGADPVAVERLLRRICPEPVGLGTSFRSSPKVLRLLGSVSAELGGKALQPNDPDAWFEGGLTAASGFATGADEAVFVRSSAELIMQHHSDATVGIISRAGWRRKPIDEEFEQSNTPFTRWDLAVDDPSVVDLVRRAADRLGGQANLDEVRKEALATVASDDVDTTHQVNDAINQVAALIPRFGTLSAALESLKVDDATDEPIPAGIHLLNAHIGKGQQFDWVFIPGFEDGHIPAFQATTSAQREEELRVLLVMISRARHGVLVTRAASLISKAGKPYNTKASPWVHLIRSGDTLKGAELANHLERESASAPSGCATPTTGADLEARAERRDLTH